MNEPSESRNPADLERRGYERLLAQNPADVDALTSLGLLAVQTGRLPPAVEYFARPSPREGGNGGLHDHLGVVYFHLKQSDRAIECFRRAMNSIPTT